MKTGNANEVDGKELGLFEPGSGQRIGTLRLVEYRAEYWNWRNVAIHVIGIVLASMLGAFTAGNLGFNPAAAALFCLIDGVCAFYVLLDLFPLKTWEVTNVCRPQD